MGEAKKYWFPAKKFGWGWGVPATWQGWVVLAVYVAAVVGVALRWPPATGAVRFVLLVGACSALLTLVCWLTGEPPRGWRRGGDS